MRPYSTIEHTKQWIRTREQNANIRNISARRALNRRIQLLRGGSRKDPEKKNIYGKTLELCPDDPSHRNGSWMPDHTCSENDGGVHQICYKKLGTNANRFSANTGQSDWSTTRRDRNHCVCLGAWSLYNSKLENGEIAPVSSQGSRLKCSAIPDTVFSQDYVDKFSTWNGHEQSDQIIHGVNGIVQECWNSGPRSELTSRYCNFVKRLPSPTRTKFEEKQLWKDVCSRENDPAQKSGT